MTETCDFCGGEATARVELYNGGEEAFACDSCPGNEDIVRERERLTREYRVRVTETVMASYFI